ncbi:ATP-binding cassette domain-containing protein [Leucobacter tardus]|uniref:ATP-binding cassette domain-containing protein n=1 Tax=Leucobacter tardus TaxID=501483 RepID=A0A939QFT1_9MICO|nr:ATP-binding cassette domain-containing protein [Leucobacter tardus]MBO2991042.1 ATP-binding cassette domain-containing protein [Leucobacter tardus]
MIQVQGVSRSFGDRLVLDDVGFDVIGGRMTGFVGGNGAGKTTTMRIILGVLSSDRGTVQFDGHEITRQDRARIGYMPEERGLYPKMPVLDQLVYLGRLHGMSTAAATASATALLDRLGLAERAKDTLESLSLGNQQRAQIAAALVHEPVALVLDEPFSGLDPMAVEVVLGVLRDYAERGAPVLFSSHQLDIVERLCDDVVVIGGGRILAQGSREGLRAEHSEHEYELVLDPRGESADTDLAWLDASPGIDLRASPVPGTARFTADTDDAAQRVLTQAVHRSTAGTGAPVRSFTPVTPTLAQIFREVVQ